MNDRRHSQRRRRRVKSSQRKQFTTRMRENQKNDWARVGPKQQKMSLRSQKVGSIGGDGRMQEWNLILADCYYRAPYRNYHLSRAACPALDRTAVITRNPFFWNVGPASSVYGDLIVRSQLCMRSLKLKACHGLCSARRLLYFARC